MSLTERVYQCLLRLYPVKHRMEFGQYMLQHARDLHRDAENEGSWQVAKFCVSLVKDGLVNGWKEHWEGIMVTNEGIRPASWLVVLLAVLPGLLILLTNRPPTQQVQLDPMIWYLYLGFLVIGVSLIWRRERNFPVWALLPFGVLAWVLIYAAGMWLSGLANTSQTPILSREGIALLNTVVIGVIMAAVLRGQRLPRSAWILTGLMVMGNLLLAGLYSLEEFGSGRLMIGVVQYFINSGVGPLEGLMLVSLGLLFAREHGVLAILVLIGGYSYMFADSDYLFGYPQRDWAWLAMYLAAVTILYLVVIPVVLLRAENQDWPRPGGICAAGEFSCAADCCTLTRDPGTGPDNTW